MRAVAGAYRGTTSLAEMVILDPARPLIPGLSRAHPSGSSEEFELPFFRRLTGDGRITACGAQSIASVAPISGRRAPGREGVPFCLDDQARTA
jgi:hypothetical protein